MKNKSIQQTVFKIVKYLMVTIILVMLNVLAGEIGLLVTGVLLFMKWEPSGVLYRRCRIDKKRIADRWNCYVGPEGEENEWCFRTRYR